MQFCFCKNLILGRRSYCNPSRRGPLADILTEAAQRYDYLDDARFAHMCRIQGTTGAITFDIGTLLALRHSLCMPQHENADRARAERIFKARERREADAPKATADYYAAQQRIRDRTQELRRLRLAREAQEKVPAG